MPMNKQNDETVLSFHDTLLRKSDVTLLHEPHWLNDNIISFYFEYLDNVVFKNNNNILFISPEVTQCLKIVSSEEVLIFLEPLDAANKPFIFFPLNNNPNDQAGGTHWSLLVLSRPENAFYHFDSMGSSNENQCEKFVRKITSVLNLSNTKLKVAHCLKQVNGYDCGIHVLCNAENIAHHLNNEKQVDGVCQLSNNTVFRMRADILNIIQKLQDLK